MRGREDWCMRGAGAAGGLDARGARAGGVGAGGARAVSERDIDSVQAPAEPGAALRGKCVKVIPLPAVHMACEVGYSLQHCAAAPPTRVRMGCGVPVPAGWAGTGPPGVAPGEVPSLLAGTGCSCCCFSAYSRSSTSPA